MYYGYTSIIGPGQLVEVTRFPVALVAVMVSSFRYGRGQPDEDGGGMDEGR